MPEVIAVFGAGTGLGASVARRFGREGYRVALVARRREPLEDLAAELAQEGIEAAAFTADFTDPPTARTAVEAILDRFGRIDVVEYAPFGLDMRFTPARELLLDGLHKYVDFHLGTLIETVQAALPGMLERKSGAILVAAGPSALHPHAGASGHGPAMAAARNYLHTLGAELADDGVYVGTIVVNAIIERSAGHAAIVAGELDIDPAKIDVVDPDELADLYWEMAKARDRVDVTHPPNA